MGDLCTKVGERGTRQKAESWHHCIWDSGPLGTAVNAAAKRRISTAKMYFQRYLY